LNSIGYNNFGTEWDDGGHQKIDKIIVGTRNSIISYIRVVYEEPDETKVLGLEHGGLSSSLKVVTLWFHEKKLCHLKYLLFVLKKQSFKLHKLKYL
jgi:Jacalin-like lectin domain